jgi:hypothetical protein
MSDVLVRVENVSKHFPIRRGIVVKKEIARVRAVDGVDLEVRRGETLGIAGGAERKRRVQDHYPVEPGYDRAHGRAEIRRSALPEVAE